MTAFVESCTKTTSGSAAAVARKSRGRPRVRQLLRKLADKKKILITTHHWPDPDALASCLALCTLLKSAMSDVEIKLSFKGGLGGGLNEMFTQLTDLQPIPWDDEALAGYDAIILLDTQPMFGNSPLPQGVMPTVVIDHHRGKGRKPNCPFCDIRPDVGATSSIIFSYFMELEQPISPDLGATLLYAIESDLAGAAGQPQELDNLALSSLTLIADTRKLYKMRYLDLPQNFFISFSNGLSNAIYYDSAIVSHLETIDSPEKPALVADFLLRFEQVKYSLVTAILGDQMMLSLRTNDPKAVAGDLMRRLVNKIGEGGGHRTKAGGVVKLANGTPTEVDRVRAILRRRYLRALGIKSSRGQRLIPRPE